MEHVDFYFDFGSPNAYLAHRVIPRIEARAPIRFDYVPILLGGVFKLTNNQSPVTAFAAVKNKLAYESLETRRFVARHGIEGFRQNPHFPVNTLMIMRGAVAAQRLGVFEAYVRQVFADMWERGRKMDDPQVVQEALAAANLPADDILRLTADDAVKATLLANTQAAVENGAFGSPSFLARGELYFGKDRLRDIEDALSTPATAPAE
jgi:2-hydroxychromene-2-carboxylate isomerase